METKKTVDMLTTNSVSILTQKFIDDNGKIVQVGTNHRKGYENTLSGREEPVELIALSDEKVEIYNDSTSDSTIIKNCSASEIITPKNRFAFRTVYT
mgnify:CR=1 FL=1